MSRFYYFISSIIFVLTLSACGDSDNPGPREAYQTNSANCSATFIADHNAIAFALRAVKVKADYDRIEGMVNDFDAKYRGAVCKAKLQQENSNEIKDATIDANAKVSLWRAAIATGRAS